MGDDYLDEGSEGDDDSQNDSVKRGFQRHSDTTLKLDIDNCKFLLDPSRRPQWGMN